MIWSPDGAAEEESLRVPLSAIYRQLDNHLGPDEAPYDVESELNRLMAWMSDKTLSKQRALHLERIITEQRSDVVAAAESARVLLQAVERTGYRRRMSALIALVSVVAFSLAACAGLFF